MSATSSVSSGRAASMARRQALSQGKGALPPPSERTRSGFRDARLAATAAAPAALPVAAAPAGGAAAAPTASAASAPPAPGAMASPAAAPGATAPAIPPGTSGRFLLRQRRMQLAQGKAGLLAARAAASAGAPSTGAAVAQTAGSVAAASAAAGQVAAASARELARARRAQMAARGRGDAAPAAPSRPPRRGELSYAPKVIASPTQSGQRVTGLRIGRGPQVTGDERGVGMPVSGTQYLAEGAARPAPAKVGQMRTAGGRIVSGTLVRSRVAITGDEAAGRIAVTGESDGDPGEDVTPGRSETRVASPQFPRGATPHGATVFGLHLGRSLRGAAPAPRAALETTLKMLPITGTAVGRSSRVTGDEDGACRAITGDQYASPAAAASACGGRGGGTAPAEHLGASRRDPVTGAKVTESLSWSGQRITGPDIEHRPAVTGDEPGSCATVTGTPYQGPATAFGWCDPRQAQAMAQRQLRQPASLPVTGDVPRPDDAVTGTERGADRAVTGTPYFRAEPAAAADDGDRLTRIAQSFSVLSPQRQAQLSARRSDEPAIAGARITGSFAVGQGKVTGSVEFQFRPRQAKEEGAKRPRITGEGRTEGPSITGDAWAANPRVTGTEGAFAAERNPSERAGKPHAFASAGLFKSKGHHEEPRQIVTGMIGWTAKSAAKVTLSGGAQG